MFCGIRVPLAPAREWLEKPDFHNFKIEGDDASCGFWFIAENGKETKATVLIENKPSRIIAMIPALVAGSYQVKITTQYTGGKPLKTSKVFVYPKALTVVN